MDRISPSRVVPGAGGALWIADAEQGLVFAAGRDGAGRVAARVEGARALAVTADQRTLYVAGGRGVVRVDLSGGAVEAAIETDGAVRDLALDEEGGLFYLALEGAGVIAVPLARGARRSIAAFDAVGLALSPDRRRLYATDGAGRVLALELRETARLIVAEGFSRLRAISVTPAGLAVADAGAAALFGVNPRHGSATPIWRGDPLSRPSGVAFDREDRSYVVADPEAGRLYRIPRDGSRADPLSLNPAR